jgi:hypothetical protein
MRRSTFWKIFAGSGAHPDVTAWRNLVVTDGGSVTSGELIAASDFRADVDSIWAKLRDVRLFPFANAFAKRRALKADWGAALVTVSGTVGESAKGFVFDGSASWLNTGLTPSTATGLDVLDSGWACWTDGVTNASANRPFGGAWSNSGTRRTGGRWRTTTVIESFNGLASEVSHATAGFAGGQRAGMIGVSRVSGTSRQYRNGRAIATVTPGANTADARPTVEERIGNANGGGSEYYHGTISAWLRFAGLTLDEYQLLQNAVEKFMLAVDASRVWVSRGDSLSTAASGINLAGDVAVAGALFQSATYDRGVGGDGIAQIDEDLVTELAGAFNDRWLVPFFSIGRNNIKDAAFSAETKLADIQAVIGRLPAAIQAVVRIGEIPPADAADEEPATTFANNRTALNALLRGWLGHRFVEWVEASRTQANRATTAERVDLDLGFTPAGLRGDTIHPNATGSAVYRAMLRASIADGIKAAIAAPVAIYNPLIWISGVDGTTATVGQTLRCVPGGWSMVPTYAYQWRRDTVAIDGATSASYTPVGADSGTSITCTVTATNSAGSATATSTGVAVT